MTYICETCEKTYSDRRSLNRHYQLNPTHKLHKSLTAFKAIENVFDGQIPSRRAARIKETIKQCNKEEIQEHILPTIHECFSKTELCFGDCNPEIICQQIYTLLFNTICKFPQQQNQICLTLQKLCKLFCPDLVKKSDVSDTNYQKREDLKCKDIEAILKNNSPAALEAIVADDLLIFKEIIMPHIITNFRQSFVDFGTSLIGFFDISQDALADILRNYIGKKLAHEVFGINIILSRDAIIHDISKTKQLLVDDLGLKFNVNSNNLVSGFIDVEKAIQFLWKLPGLKNTLTAPLNKVILCDFTDDYPFLETSKWYSGECSVDVKIIEPNNMMDTRFPACFWLGEEGNASECGQAVYHQLSELTSIKHPLSQEAVGIVRRSTADGKFRRFSLSCSTAKSAEPIVEAPEHSSQLGDMKIICNRPEFVAMENPQEATSEVEQLSQILLQSAHNGFSTAKPTYVDISSALDYRVNKQEQTATNIVIHLSSFTVDGNIRVRKDHRVSKEILKVTLNGTKARQMVVEHSSEQGGGERYIIPLNTILGMNLNNQQLITNTSVQPKFQRKVTVQNDTDGKKKCTTKWENSNYPSPAAGKISEIILKFNSVVIDGLLSRLKSDTHLSPCIQRGIMDDYPQELYITDKYPHQYFPILKDVVLVKAAQKSVFQLLQLTSSSGSWDLLWLIKMFDGIEKQFNSLLASRLHTRRH